MVYLIGFDGFREISSGLRTSCKLMHWKFSEFQRKTRISKISTSPTTTPQFTLTLTIVKVLLNVMESNKSRRKPASEPHKKMQFWAKRKVWERIQALFFRVLFVLRSVPFFFFPRAHAPDQKTGQSKAQNVL